MFASFNVTHFAAIAAVYLVFLVLSQVYLKQMIAATSKFMGFDLTRTFYLSAALVLVTIAAWGSAIYFYGISATTVLVLAMVTESTIGFIRRKTIRETVLTNMASFEPVNFNDINGVKL